MLYNHSIQSEAPVGLKQLICCWDGLLGEVSLHRLIKRGVIVIVFLLHWGLQIVLFHKGRSSDKCRVFRCVLLMILSLDNF
jgi:hypothetical protein